MEVGMFHALTGQKCLSPRASSHPCCLPPGDMSALTQFISQLRLVGKSGPFSAIQLVNTILARS